MEVCWIVWGVKCVFILKDVVVLNGIFISFIFVFFFFVGSFINEFVV